MGRYGLYLHIPFCRAKCAYCAFDSSPDVSKKPNYLAALAQEAALRASLVGSDAADSVYLGGGTPSVLEAEEFTALVRGVRRSLSVTPDAEFTVECNPESVTEEKLDAYLSCGVTRISLGVQSLDDEVLRRCGRLHNAAGAAAALSRIAGRFSSYSVDYILGLPGQTAEDLDRLCELVAKYGVRHVSAYGLKVEEGTRLHGMVASGEVSTPDEDATADLYDALVRKLAALGLERYEISNFAFPGCECRHNLKYWTNGDYLGLGVAAHSYYGGYRFFNGDSVGEYVAALAAGSLYERGRERVSDKDAEFTYVMLRLRTSLGVDRAEFRRLFGADFALKHANVLQRYAPFFTVSEDAVKLTSDGFYVINSLLINFA